MSHLSVLDEKAAFVDVGSEQMHVSIAGGPPEVFGTVTAQLHALRDWLLAREVRSVAMEATGVYWLPLYGVLETAGLAVVMVNGRQTKNLPGRKTDMQDCQWGATLHAHGLLRAGFVPPAHIRRLQDYVRLRADHISRAASHVQHMQKALERMNIKLHDVTSSLCGVSGLAVVRAILAGERAPERLLALCDPQIQRAKGDRVKEALRGTWAEEHLFALRQALQSWEHYQGQIAECDRQIARDPHAAQAPRRERARHPAAAQLPRADVRGPRPDGVAGPHRIQRAATGLRGGHGVGSMADREALHLLAGAGAGQPSERQAPRQRQAPAQPRRAPVLRDGPQSGAQQEYCTGRLLPSHGGASGRAGCQHRPGT